MWLFICADSLTFAACLVAYSYVRLASTAWPRPFDWSSILNAIVMTACLLSSSLTMVMAVAAASQGERKRAVRFILLTMAGGALFDVLHVPVRLGLLHRVERPASTPWVL